MELRKVGSIVMKNPDDLGSDAQTLEMYLSGENYEGTREQRLEILKDITFPLGMYLGSNLTTTVLLEDTCDDLIECNLTGRGMLRPFQFIRNTPYNSSNFDLTDCPFFISVNYQVKKESTFAININGILGYGNEFHLNNYCYNTGHNLQTTIRPCSIYHYKSRVSVFCSSHKTFRH